MKPLIKKDFLRVLRSSPPVSPQGVDFEMQVFESGQVAFCAFGVLGSIFVVRTSPLIGFVPMRGDADCYFLQEVDELKDWAGIDDDEIEQLTVWNDVDKLSFGEIAEKVEAAW